MNARPFAPQTGPRGGEAQRIGVRAAGRRVRRGSARGLGWAAILFLGVGLNAVADQPVGEITENILSSLTILGAPTNAEPIQVFERVSSVAKEMRGPDGIARDPETGDLFVAEEDGAAIVRIKRGGSKQPAFSSLTPLYEKQGDQLEPVQGLRSPEGLAVDAKKGILYAVEDVPGGRLVSFSIRKKVISSRASGEVIPLPLENSRIAWEDVDVGPNGELLLAGSTMESSLTETGEGGLFRGVILYRDVEGTWWTLVNHAMASYSAARFSADGNYALIASEIPGNVGCLDLRSRYLRIHFSNKTFRSPEGLCPLPGGAVLVAEESGKIYWMDPVTDVVQLLHDVGDTIESLAWDAEERRLLVTVDARGELQALKLKAMGDFQSSRGKVEDIPFKEQSTPVEMIPDECPEYLAEVLKLGGYDSKREGGALAFRDFAKRYCLVSIDAEARLTPKHKPVEDPIQRIQFVIVAPYLIGYQEGELIWSSSGFTVVKESGQVLKTELVKRQVVHGDLMESRFTPMGGQNIALPMPFSARINADGFVSVNFMGMGVMADFYLVLDTTKPNQSVMVVVQPDGFVQQYELHLPPNKGRDHWVVALERKGPDVWKKMPFRK